MYLYIYVHLLTYVNGATSKVTLCPHEVYRQGYFSINISNFWNKDFFLPFFTLAKQEKTFSVCSSGPNFGTGTVYIDHCLGISKEKDPRNRDASPHWWEKLS